MRHLAASVPDPQGRLSFDLTGSGDLAAPRVNGMIAVRDLSMAALAGKAAAGDGIKQVAEVLTDGKSDSFFVRAVRAGSCAP